MTASENLERQGYEVYLPMVEQRKRVKGERRTSSEPLFPRYLFIHLDSHSDNWRPIRSTVGVANLVRFGSIPTPVPDELLDGIRERENENGIVPLTSVRAVIGKGARIRITDGAMTGVEGIFLAQTSQDRVTVLLELMGKSSKVSLPIDAVEPDH